MNILHIRQWGHYQFRAMRSAVDIYTHTGASRWTGTVALLSVIVAIWVIATTQG
jgi:hypothetical protein